MDDKNSNIIARGKCGEDAKWTLDSEGTLIVSGSGKLGKSSFIGAGRSPWRKNRDEVKHVIIEGISQIGTAAFRGCIAVESIRLPDSIESIGARAFDHCVRLTEITIPAAVNSIGSAAFTNCTSLTEIHVAPENEAFSSIDGVLYNKDKTLIRKYPALKPAEDYTIAPGVTVIGYGAFSNCKHLKSVIIPDSVVSIENAAFSFCNNIHSLRLPAGVTKIGSYAFDDCTSLPELTIPKGVVHLGIAAFADWSPSQTIYIEGHKSAPATWNTDWHIGCKANIVYV